MMGASQATLDVPILKGTTGVVILTERDIRVGATYPCIHCGRCLDACPMFLNPQSLGELARAGRYDEMQDQHLADCMLCGSCSFVCPANIPLAQLFFLSKNALKRKPRVVDAPTPAPVGAV